MTREDIEKVWLTNEAIHIRLKDGREAKESFSDYPRLKFASDKEKNDYTLEFYGIHWPTLDEDFSYDGFFTEKRHNNLYTIFMSHPELNAAEIARRLGISQNLMAQYLSGNDNPSKEREQQILNELRKVGNELLALTV